MIAYVILCSLLLTVADDELGKQACVTKEWAPIAIANQGNYKFEYQSGYGIPDKFACLTYRARNSSGKQLTTIIWKEDSNRQSRVLLQSLFDECPAGGQCPWDESVHVVDLVDKGDTYLGFGANSDQYKEHPTAFRRSVKTVSGKPPLTTTLRRIVGDTERPEVLMGIRVTSTAEGEAGSYQPNIRLNR